MKLRGACYNLTTSTEHEVVISGPRDTGKTVACSQKLHNFASLAPGCQLGIVRKTQASMAGTVLKTFDRVIRGHGVTKYGGANPTRYMYPNGSVIWVGGMDNPGKVLSSERDAIYVNQAEELEEGDWETLGACCSGRGAIVQYPQLFGDCNPGPPNHWILKRSKRGVLRLLEAGHKDNPDLFDEAGNPTLEFAKRMAVLEAYTGVRRMRMLLGKWTSAEGAVYEFSRAGYEVIDEVTKRLRKIGPHVVTRAMAEMKRFYLAMDEGYTNPAVILLIGEDNDGRWHLFKEFYKRGVIQSAVVTVAKEWFGKPDKDRVMRCDLAAVDEAAAGLIADLLDAGVGAVPGKGRVLDGIQRIQNRLACAKDGKPRFTVAPECEETINEFESYQWKPDKDQPEKENDHCFAAGTRVITKKGLKQIQSIRPGESLLTPIGWNKVLRSGSGGVKATVNYGRFWATPDHKILTTKGLKRLDSLSNVDTLMVCQEAKRWNLMGLFIGAIRTPKEAGIEIITNAVLPKIVQARESYTGMSGSSTTERFLRGLRYITRIWILVTTRFLISNYLLTMNTLRSTIGEAVKSTWRVLGRWRLNGTVAQMDLNGIQSMERKHGLIEKLTQRFANLVERNINRHALIKANTALEIANNPHCAGAGIPILESINQEVYNLDTEFGCFFAGGILVSNSLDAARYLSDVLDEPTGAFGPEDLELGMPSTATGFGGGDDPFVSVDHLKDSDL